MMYFCRNEILYIFPEIFVIIIIQTPLGYFKSAKKTFLTYEHALSYKL